MADVVACFNAVFLLIRMLEPLTKKNAPFGCAYVVELEVITTLQLCVSQVVGVVLICCLTTCLLSSCCSWQTTAPYPIRHPHNRIRAGQSNICTAIMLTPTATPLT